jgi:protein-S-isoprenylcysteine O-methyltransferase Ste14
MAKDLRNDPRYQDHERRPDLAGEHPVGDTYQLIGMLVFITACTLDYFLVGWAQRLSALVPLWVRLPLSLVFLVLGGWLALRGIQVVFGEYREEPVMLTEWMFAYMRHPIYLGAILIYVAVLVFVMSPLGLLVWLGVLGLYQWLAKHEEDLMTGIFGDEYRAYQQRVPMWLPFKFRK